MDIADQFEKIRIFFAHNGFVSVLKEVTASFMAFIECNGVTGHQFAHDLAERGRAGAQEEMEMVRNQGPGVALGLGVFQDFGQAVEKRLSILVVAEELAAFDPSGHDMLEKAGSV
jgi:hypothetical protein